jgi:hypothetical protein
MSNEEKLTPAELDDRNQALIKELQHKYAIDEQQDTQSLARVRQRLLNNASSMPYAIPQTTRQPIILKTRQERPAYMHSTSSDRPERRTWQHRLSTIAAVVFATLLVGSLLLLFTHTRQSNMGGSGNPTATIFTPATIPTSIFGRGWKLVANFNGTGSKIIAGQHIDMPNTWGARFNCVGKGEETILFNQRNGGVFLNGPCHSEQKGSLDFRSSGPMQIHQIEITVDHASVWQLQIATCTDESICGAPTPTPAPTQIPIPTGTPTSPVPTPSGEQSPTPVPTMLPTPTTPPTPMPTPTPKP